jgi:hypothetical protein
MLGLSWPQALELRYQLLHRTAAAILEADRFECSQAVMLVHHFADAPEDGSDNFEDFKRFTYAIGAPISGRNGISDAVCLERVHVRFAWIDDQPAAPDALQVAI